MYGFSMIHKRNNHNIVTIKCLATISNCFWVEIEVRYAANQTSENNVGGVYRIRTDHLFTASEAL
jgi:hypothetical protein